MGSVGPPHQAGLGSNFGNKKNKFPLDETMKYNKNLILSNLAFKVGVVFDLVGQVGEKNSSTI